LSGCVVRDTRLIRYLPSPVDHEEILEMAHYSLPGTRSFA
jgi:hypothetical protein